MNHIELLFAAEVLKLAKELQTTAREGFLRAAGKRLSPAETAAKVAAWDQSFPISGFVLLATDEITHAARLISNITSSDNTQEERQEMPPAS